MLRRFLRTLWCLPQACAGHALRYLLCSLPQGCTVQRMHGVTLVTGAPVARFLLLPGYAAMAVGDVIFSPDRATLRRHLRHELQHVRQSRRYGFSFALLYAGSSLLCLLRGQRPYWDNYFELEARAAER